MVGLVWRLPPSVLTQEVSAPANVSGAIGWLAGQVRVMRAVALIKRPWVTNDVDCLSTSVRMLSS